MSNPDLIAPQPYSKEEVKYRHHESCKTCSNYNGRIRCNLVRGNVSPDAVCSKWTMQEAVVGVTNKEFFEKAYVKKEEG